MICSNKVQNWVFGKTLILLSTDKNNVIVTSLSCRCERRMFMYNLSAYCVDVASMAVIRTMQQAAAVAVDVDSILQQHINSSCQQGGFPRRHRERVSGHWDHPACFQVSSGA